MFFEYDLGEAEALRDRSQADLTLHKISQSNDINNTT
jgi:hypothetical protein